MGFISWHYCGENKISQEVQIHKGNIYGAETNWVPVLRFAAETNIKRIRIYGKYTFALDMSKINQRQETTVCGHTGVWWSYQKGRISSYENVVLAL